jgi:hypothetical protein
VSMGVPDRRVAGLLLGLLACLSGGPLACSGAAATDFALDAAAPRDATTPPETSSTEMDATGPVVDAGRTDDEDSAAIDASAIPEAGVTPDSGGGGSADSGEAGASLCSMICMGCCDALGKCRTGNTMAVCGVAGGTCDDCSTHKCTTLTEAPCCGSKGCGCAVAGLIGCN